ncbi:PREDICTED: globoside alpha-1,3-N-acetylgalactosaminyltransferase 1-like isoform X3 [Sturnus vulgaris]|uniref:globoside alpha-1,3-N-acetylgalactosaminyltransferase 1-like isoform X3 n=1 Tax=Sturnus vulgaris TaxID=9172 RepID=UPI00071A3F6C|nr:PREDICTED: globoside alpha-1,3-N-acetylgalactosaminyltransferase 1-like isoform X3 [Sturnus vulgaris]
MSNPSWTTSPRSSRRPRSRMKLKSLEQPRVRAGESLMKLVSDLKQFLILNDFPSVNEAINQRNQQLRSLQEECDKKLIALRDEISIDLYELEEEYYSSSYSLCDSNDLPLCEAYWRQDFATLSPESLSMPLAAAAAEQSVVTSQSSTPSHPHRSAEQHFMRGYQVNYYIFTDSPASVPSLQLQPGRSLATVPMAKFSSWQEISMRRMEAISRHVAQVSGREVQYLFCLDVDMVFHNPWGPETLGDMVAAIHPGYFTVPREQFPYERRSSSAAFIPEGEGDFYYGGAVFGGLVNKVYEFTKSCHMTILADKANGIMAAWQEESHLNRHFLTHKPSKLLSPEYIWDDRKPKPPEIRLIRFSTVDKDYKEVRN